MKSYNLSISYAKEKLEDYEVILMDYGYSELTIKEKKKKIKKFLSMSDDNSPYSIERISEYVNSFKKEGYSISYISDISCALRVYFYYLSTSVFNPGYGKEIKTITLCEDDVILFNSYMSKFNMKQKEYTLDVKTKRAIRFLSDLRKVEIDIKNLNESFITSYAKDKTYEYVMFIKSFLKHLFLVGILQYDLSVFIHAKKRIKKIPSVYSDNELELIMNYYSDDTLIGIRNKAIIMIATTTGLRSCDIVNLKYSNFDMDNNQIHIVQIKTGEPISLYINDELKELIKKYNSLNIHKNNEYLFTNEVAPFGLMGTGSIRYLLRKAINDLGLKKEGRKMGPHSLRSSFATSLAQDDVSYDVIEKLLGHQNSDSLSSYVLTDIEKLRKCSLSTYEPSGDFKKWLGV